MRNMMNHHDRLQRIEAWLQFLLSVQYPGEYDYWGEKIPKPKPPLQNQRRVVTEAGGMSNITTPLWLIMENAFLEGRQPGFNDRYGYAAEIRAVTDWLVPKQMEPKQSAMPLSDWCQQVAAWEARQAIRQRLLDEARRAEGWE